MNATLTAVRGLIAGHHTDRENGTGCTAILCMDGAVGGVDVRGGSPGTRETDLLRPLHRVERIHGIMLSGGSAFGLEAANGAMRFLSQRGVGVKVGPAIVPIVASAILFDLNLIAPVHPDAAAGYSACQAASSAPLPEGSVGTGTGATVAKLRGLERAVKGGLGCAAVTLPGGATVAAAVAVNAVGGVVDYRSGKLLAGPRRQDGAGFHDSTELLLKEGASASSPPFANTTIGVVATDAMLTKEQANFLAQVSHDGQALAIRPSHTMRDGDTMFVLATCRVSQLPDLTQLGAAAVEVTAQAILRAVQTATGLGGVPSISELRHA